MNIKSNLKENDWSTIIEVANKGEGQNYWNIGDEIDLVLSGKYNETITLQIWDFNHFDKSDGTGKANILFGMKHLMKDRECMNSGNSMGTWNDSYMRNTVIPKIFNSIPIELRDAIKEVNIYTNMGGGDDIFSGQGLLSKDKVFLPGLTECDNNWYNQNQTETGQKKFPIFPDNNSRIKKLNNGTGSAEWWWTRSPFCYYSSYFCCFDYDGDYYNNFASNSCGVCFCFNI